MYRKKHFCYDCAVTNNQLTLYKIDLELDFDLLYIWMHQPHVAKFWQLNKSRIELYDYFQNLMTIQHQELFVLGINHSIIAYGEVYNASKDRLADFYPVNSGDYGIHLLIGDEKNIGKGYSSTIVRGLSDYLFRCCNAHRVLVEPSIEVKQLTSLEYKLGFKNLGIIQLPEKIATLYAIELLDFYKVNPSRINCTTNNWPIIHIHFPSFPTDETVSIWIKQLDSLVTTSESYVVITTFDRNYQFSQSARKEQMAWFKRNKVSLSQNCLAMLRVTNDPDMIDKLSKPAMKKGMPFRCIACPSFSAAAQMARDLLKEI